MNGPVTGVRTVIAAPERLGVERLLGVARRPVNDLPHLPVLQPTRKKRRSSAGSRRKLVSPVGFKSSRGMRTMSKSHAAA